MQELGVKDFCPDRQLEGEVAKAIEEVGKSLSQSDYAHNWWDTTRHFACVLMIIVITFFF